MTYGKLKIASDQGVNLVPQFKTTMPQPFGRVVGHSEHGFPIPTGVGLGLLIYQRVTEAYFSGVRYDFNPKLTSYSKQVNDEVYRFYTAILAYYDSRNPIIHPNRLFDLIKEEEKGIVWLKKAKTIVLHNSYGAYPEEYDPDDEYIRQEVKSWRLLDLGDFFNVRYWLFFDQPDPHDEDSMFLPISRVDPALLKDLENTINSMLPESFFNVIEEEEILLSNSGSSSLSSDSKSKPVWFEKQHSNYFSSEPLFGKMAYIQKCPGDTRSSITLSVPHSNSVKLIEKQIAEIASEVAFSCYVKDDVEYFNRYNAFKDRNQFYYCRDVAKDGLTKNRKLVQLVLGCIKRKYKHLPACKYFGIYDNFYVRLPNGAVVNPPRGVGLGMSSAITTLLYCATFRMTLDRLHADYQVGSADALFYHDDAVLGSDNEETLEELKDIDTKLLSDLQIPVKLRKCFTSDKFFVLCENYSDEFLNEKESYQRTLLSSLYASENVTEAKQKFLANYRYADVQLWKVYAVGLASYFGYEFYPGEVQSPSLFGGWVPCQYQGLDISFWSCPNPSRSQSAAACVTLQPIKLFKGKRLFSDQRYKSPVSQLYPTATNFGGCDSAYFMNMTEREVANSFTRMNRPGLSAWYWDRQFRLRRDKYNSAYYAGPYTNRALYNLLRGIHSKTDIIPPQDLWILSDVSFCNEVERLYQPPNPYLQFLKYCNPTAVRNSILPWPIPPDAPRRSHRALTATEREKAKLLHTFFPGWTANWGELQITVPTLRLIPSTEWYNPMAVVAFVSATTGFNDHLIRFDSRPELNVNYDWDVYQKLHRPGLEGLLPFLTSRYGFERAKELDFTYLLEELDTRIQKRKRLQLLEVYKKVKFDMDQLDISGDTETSISKESGRSEYTDSQEWNDEDFWLWRTSKQKSLNWRNPYFIQLNMKIELLELADTSHLNKKEELSEQMLRELILIDPVERHLWISSGGRLDDRGIPILERHGIQSGSADNESDVDIFKEEGRSDSSGGLMEGW